MAGSDLVKTYTQVPPIVGEDSKAVTGTDIGAKRALDVNLAGGSVNIAGSGFLTPLEPYDGVYGSYPNATTEVYTYKDGLTTKGTVTVVYTDTTKEFVLSAVRVVL